LIFSTSCRNDNISPETDFLTHVYASGYNWDTGLYSISKNLLNIALRNDYLSLSEEVITANIPSNLNSRVMRVEVGTMTKQMRIYQPKFYYVNTDMIYIRDGMSFYIGFAYIFTEKNDNSIYYCKILMI
jgi:hypothetical protein